ncbi:hypothetical protein EPH95_06255 [Salicibibacter halophilus]|uniref:Uncharacterized protein n=1 Tax=Salicibibacter halophilus TaxID=2502791 RepID=A0A514LG46_9BACI|nr:hypothetical protein [Salicibibacter halophilus]QDI90826.1 hypothetical protein EPH95_06255 [Salicibibacter halophilus]
MTSWTAWLVVVLAVAGLVYAIYSVTTKKSLGLYISAVVHMILGVITLPSIGLIILGLAILELIGGIILTLSSSSVFHR